MAESAFRISIANGDRIEPVPESEYKPKGERPEDRILIVSDGERSKALAWIGPGIDAWMEDSGEDGEWGLGPGLWIAKVRYSVFRCGEHGTDYDSEIDLFEPRKLTEQEWEMFCECPNEGPWRPGDWLVEQQDEFPKEGPSDLPEGW